MNELQRYLLHHSLADLTPFLATAVMSMIAGGLIVFFWRRGSAPPAEAWELRPAPQVAQIEREIGAIKKLLCVDSLTGLQNGWVLEQEALPEALRNAAARDKPLTFACGDMDGLKAINAVHNHTTADKALARVGRIATAVLGAQRSTDRAFRLYKTGDEFGFLLPGADQGHAVDRLEQLLAQLNDCNVQMSIGAVVVPPQVDVTPQDVINAADAAMKRAKEAGKNRVVVEVLS